MVVENQPLITLHWLEQSRSHRIAWLLEELELEYTLKLYHKTDGYSAPPELKEIFPIGKAPIVEVKYSDSSEPLILAESGHIINYLIKNFDTTGKLTPKTHKDKSDVDYFIFFSEATMGAHMSYVVVHNNHMAKAALHSRTVISKFLDKLHDGYSTTALKKCADLLESQLSKKSKGKSSSSQEIFMVGDQLSGADIILFLNTRVLLDTDRIGAVKKKDYPLLSKWLSQMFERSALKKANAKVETLGEGKYPI